MKAVRVNVPSKIEEMEFVRNKRKGDRGEIAKIRRQLQKALNKLYEITKRAE